ncbi:cysteine hydrolase family protein [Pseudactinotalea terrae]|uniref:cysteine hydrolase family protein n=1 Tax=Pseudactinotalea terrae TaxID=1743262 RepID=UPI001F5028E3|nr:cysteine hydrolase [Pseudactinotalea terrae]
MSAAPWLVVIDHQRVFADPASAWGSPMFAATVPVVAELAREHGDRVITTRWVPAAGPERIGSWVDYFQAWPFADKPADDPLFDLVPSARALAAPHVLTRPTFGKWGVELEAITGPGPRITLVGVSTDCCVISTALAAADGGASVRVVASGCAGSTLEAHENALAVMRLYAPQIEVV